MRLAEGNDRSEVSRLVQENEAQRVEPNFFVLLVRYSRLVKVNQLCYLVGP